MAGSSSTTSTRAGFVLMAPVSNFGRREPGPPNVRPAPGTGELRHRSLRTVQRQVELQHVHAGFAQQAKQPALSVLVDQRAHLRLAQAAGLGDARALVVGRRRADVRVEAAGGCGQQVRRYGSLVFRIVFTEFCDGGFYPFN